MSHEAESSGYSSDKMEHPRQSGSPILAAMVAAVLMIVFPSLDVRANCQDLLDSDTYRCRVKSDDEDRFTDCFRFASPGTQSEDFDLFSDVLGGVVACDCKATGTFAAPNFGAANSFHCVTTSAAEFGLTFEGAVRRAGRIIIGQAVNDTGISFIFRCNRATSREVPLSTLGAPAASW
jgi:hypothetical protein